MRKTSASAQIPSGDYVPEGQGYIQGAGNSWNTFSDVHQISSQLPRETPDYQAQLEELRKLLADQMMDQITSAKLYKERLYARIYGYNGVFRIDGDAVESPQRNELGEIGL